MSRVPLDLQNPLCNMLNSIIIPQKYNFSGICLYQFDSNSGGRLNASGHSRAKLQNGTVSSKNQRKTHPIHPELSSNNPSTGAAEPSNN